MPLLSRTFLLHIESARNTVLSGVLIPIIPIKCPGNGITSSSFGNAVDAKDFVRQYGLRYLSYISLQGKPPYKNAGPKFRIIDKCFFNL